MAMTNCDFTRSPLLKEQYQRDMDLIAALEKVRTNVRSVSVSLHVPGHSQVPVFMRNLRSTIRQYRSGSGKALVK